MLRAADVSFAYRREPVLRNVSLEVAPGNLLGILGPNGSGKTTLLRVLAGTLQPGSGRVTMDGTDLRTIPRARLARRMAMVPQETHLAFDYSVLEIALMGRYAHLGAFEIEGPDDLAIARNALSATGMLELQDRPFETLSGGEKQRVVIASALAQLVPRRREGAKAYRQDGTGAETPGWSPGGPGSSSVATDDVTATIAPKAPGHEEPDPGILLLDEPTASLDLGYQLEIAAILARLGGDRPLAVIVSTHDLNLAAGLCRRLVLLREGRVLAAGDTRTVLTAAAIRDLYGVDAEVRFHEGTGRLTVLPMARAGAPGGERRRA